MNITVTKQEELTLSRSEVECVVTKWLDEYIGDHFVRDGELYRQDDYGHHRGGIVDTHIKRLSADTRYDSSPDEMSAHRYDFTMTCIAFRLSLKTFKAKDT